MVTKVKGCKELVNEVISKDLCCLCGACAGSCPYLISNGGRIVQMDSCTLTDGQCYQYCPRTFVDMDAISQHVFGIPYGADELGTVKEILIARSTDTSVRNRAQYGGSVTALLALAMAEGVIDSAIVTRTTPAKTPEAFLARNAQQLSQAAGSNYMACPVLEIYNHLPEESGNKLAIVGVPCQVVAATKMKREPPRHRASTGNIKLAIGLFCTWALAQNGFHRYLNTMLNLPSATKFDIPPPPANRFDVFTSAGKVSLPLETVREFTMPTCAYCIDMTSEFADISVGSVEGMEGWNTLIVRTSTGAKLVEMAKKHGKLETGKLPAENLSHLKSAALTKKQRSLGAIIKKTGNKGDLLYLGLSPAVVDKLLS